MVSRIVVISQKHAHTCYVLHCISAIQNIFFLTFSQQHGMLIICNGKAVGKFSSDFTLNMDLGLVSAFNTKTTLRYLSPACCYSSAEMLLSCKLSLWVSIKAFI